MNRHSYWDQVLVVDGEIPFEMLQEAKNQIVSSGAQEKGLIAGANPQATKYYYVPDADNKSIFIVKHLESLGVIPKIEGYETRYQIRYHVMTPGGKMAWHTDSTYSIAVSIYLTDSVGGELQIHPKDDLSQSVILSPKQGRVVIMKCDNLHRVLELQEGSRESIQVFITYFNEKESAT